MPGDGSCGVRLLEVFNLGIKGPSNLVFCLLPRNPNHQKDKSQDIWGHTDQRDTFTASNPSLEHVFGLGGNRSIRPNLTKKKQKNPNTPGIKEGKPEASGREAASVQL